MLKEDKSYISGMYMTLVENGYAELDLYGIRIQREYNEAEKAENLRMSNLLSREAWLVRCEERRKKNSTEVEEILENLKHDFYIYSLDSDDMESFVDKWDLYFWCNCDSDNKRDYSYVTLNFNKKTLQERYDDLERLKAAVKRIDTDSISFTIQFTSTQDSDKIKETAKKYFDQIKGFVTYDGQVGRIKEHPSCDYIFLKKGAKKKGYQVTPEEMVYRYLSEADEKISA